MKNKLIFALFFSLLPFLAVAQCENCPKIPEEKIDYCFTSEHFPNQCAQFVSGKDYFYINGKKASKKIVFNKDEEHMPYLLKLAANKKLKLKTLDILFVGEALKSWKEEEPKIGFEFAESGMGIKILEEGTGKLPERGRKVTVHYSGFLDINQEKKFDSSVDRGQPFAFNLGVGQVIKGWDVGIAQLKVGTKAILWIPPQMGYGSRGVGDIPPNSTLFFWVEVMAAD